MATPKVNTIGSLADQLTVGQEVEIDMSLVSLQAYSNLGFFVATDLDGTNQSPQELVAKSDEKWIQSLDKKYGTARVTCCDAVATFLIAHLAPSPEMSTVTIPQQTKKQVGGSHYSSMAIQPLEFLKANLPHVEYMAFLKGNVQKYTFRSKSPLEDYKKAKHYTELMIEAEQEAISGY